MESTAHGWKVFDADTPVLTFEYSFGPGTANALAVRGAAGMIVVSPPFQVVPEVLDDLLRVSPVRALVASNAFHYMGIPSWRARFREAALFAPLQSIARVERRTRLAGFKPLADAAALAGPRLQLIDMPHYKTGELLVKIHTAQGLVWYVTDCILNFPTVPAHPIFGFMFRVSGSAPGLKLNNLAPLFMVEDKAALKRWLATEFEKEPPRWLIPAHGDIAELGTDPALPSRLFGSG